MSKVIFNEAQGTIQIKDVRLSYPHDFKPWAQNDDQDKKYSARFLLPTATHGAEIKAIQQYLTKMMAEKFKARIPLDKLFMRDYKFKNTVMGVEFGGTQKQTLLTMRYGDIPSGERAEITKALKARGVENPTAADVFSVFLRKHGQDNAAGAAKRALVPVNTGGMVAPATSASRDASPGYSMGEYADATKDVLGQIISYRPDPQYVEEDARASANRMAFGKGLSWGDLIEKGIVDPMILNKR